jgi:hypothetical protein
MSVKLLWATALVFGLSSGLAFAQISGDQTTRSPVTGDPVQKTKKTMSRASRRAANIARSDKQAPGTENGNQPDRASAGGGAR